VSFLTGENYAFKEFSKIYRQLGSLLKNELFSLDVITVENLERKKNDSLNFVVVMELLIIV